MKVQLKTAMLFAAFSAAIGGTAIAQEMRPMGDEGHVRPHGSLMRLERAVNQHDGAIDFQEFAATVPHVMKADSNGDGKVTVEELAAYIEKVRAERLARRTMERLTGDPNGTVTQVAVQDREHKLFALMDRNNDGKIEKNELPHRPFLHHAGWRPMDGQE